MGVRDDIRASRRAQGQSAKERVLSGQYNQPQQQEQAAEPESIRDRIRGRSFEQPAAPAYTPVVDPVGLMNYSPPVPAAAKPLPAWKAIGKEVLGTAADTGKALLENVGRPVNAVKGVLDYATDSKQTDFKDLLNRVGGALAGKEQTSMGDIFNNLGFTEMGSDPTKQGLGQYILSQINNKGRNLAGLVGDVAADPLTYAGGIGLARSGRSAIAEAPQPTLALPMGRADAARAARPAPSAGTDPIVTPYQFDLPEGRVAPPTTARVAQQANPYRQQFEDLMAQAQSRQAAGGFTPGREAEELESLWSQVAGREAPSLDELINGAYKPQPNRITPDLVQRARTGQAAREVAGAPLPVRSTTDRMPQQGVISEAAPIAQKIGRRPGLPPIREPETLAAEAAQPPRIDVTPADRPLISTQPSGSTLGISPFGGRVKAYDNPAQDTKSQLVTRQDREKLPLGVRADIAYTKITDDLHPLRLFDRLVEKIKGSKLDPLDSSHTLALGSRGSDVISKEILTKDLVDINGNVVGKGLKTILSQLPKKKYAYVDFEDYLVNAHAITRHVRGEKVFDDRLQWTPGLGQQKMMQYEEAYPQFKQMADEIYTFQNQMAQHWLVDTGMIPQETLDAWMAANPTYVPNKRFFSKLEKRSGGQSRAAKGLVGQKSPVKGYDKSGSQRPIISPIESMIENVDGFVNVAKRNRSMQAVVNNLELNPEALEGFAKIVDETQVMSSHSIKDINKILNEDGLDGLMSRLSNDYDGKYRKAMQTGLDKDNIVPVMMDGKPVYIDVQDPQFLDAITAMGPDSADSIMKTLGRVTQFFKVTTTGANPVFSLARNIWRDIPQAYIASKTTDNPFQFIGDLIYSGYAIATNKQLFQEFKRVGGGHSSSIAADRNLLGQTKRQVLPQGPYNVKAKAGAVYDKYLDALNAVESAPRLAEFKRLTERGGNSPDSKLKGLFESQDVTTNFKRRGSFTRQADRVFPYAGAAVQGLDKAARMFKDQPVKTTLKAVLALSIPSMIAYALNYDNPDYAKVSRLNRDNYILIPKGDGTFFKLAKPKELGTIFTDVQERLMDMFLKQDPDAFKGFANQIRTNFLPPGIQGALKGVSSKGIDIPSTLYGGVGDTILGPVANAAANKDFANNPIVPAALNNLSPKLQSDPKTTVIAKWIGEQTGSSPKLLDYLIKQYTGVFGQIGGPAFSPGSTVGNSLLQQVTVDPVYSNDISNKMYDAKGKLDQARTDYNTTGGLPDDYNEGLRKYLGKVTGAMSDIRKQMRAIEADKTIRGANKRIQLRDLQEQINQLAAQGNDAVASTK